MPKLIKYLSIVSIYMVVFGLIARAWYYFSNRSLFIDEANIARNVYEKDFSQLSGNLNYEQHAPPVFMWIIKFICSITNYSEYALRFFPFICGIAAIILFFKVAQKALANYSLWFALGLFACNFILIQFSSEIKQYESDALIAIIFLYIFYQPAVKPSYILIILFGALSIWLSMPAIFMLAALGVYLVLEVYHRNRDFKDIIIIFLSWIISFVLLYYVNLNNSLHTKALLEAHENYFIQIPIFNEGRMNLGDNLIDFFRNVTGKSTIGIVAGILFFTVAVIIGIKKKDRKYILLCGPLLFCLIASYFRVYSLMPRLMAFSLPFIIILMAKGLDIIIEFINTVVKYNSQRIISISLLFVCGIACMITQDGFPFIDKKFIVEEIKPVLQYVKKESVPGSNYFVQNNAVPAFEYYTKMHPDKELFKPIGSITYGTWETDYISLIKEAEKNNDQKHWFIFNHIYGEELEKLNQTISNMKPPAKKLTAKGSVAYLY